MLHSCAEQGINALCAPVTHHVQQERTLAIPIRLNNESNIVAFMATRRLLLLARRYMSVYNPIGTFHIFVAICLYLLVTILLVSGALHNSAFTDSRVTTYVAILALQFAILSGVSVLTRLIFAANCNAYRDRDHDVVTSAIQALMSSNKGGHWTVIQALNEAREAIDNDDKQASDLNYPIRNKATHFDIFLIRVVLVHVQFCERVVLVRASKTVVVQVFLTAISLVSISLRLLSS
jgi:hypothetical protein